MLKTLILIGVT